MEPIVLQRPREMQVHKPVRVVLVGGFLGAGKTTALGALAKHLMQQGLKVGIVTNDQAAHLVDTAILEELKLPVAEVAGGCFCCRFTDLLDAAQSVLAQEPDILLCEPVGSCTDMVATVINPLRYFYGEQFSIAPFTVLADPQRVREYLSDEAATPFMPEVGFIFGKQLAEADVIALTKTDTLTPQEADRLNQNLQERYHKPVLNLSAVREEGIGEWAARLLHETSAGAHALQELDYDTYARGEAVLGWLNATVRVQGTAAFDGDSFLTTVAQNLSELCRKAHAEIAHIKLLLRSGNGFRRVHITTSAAAPLWSAGKLGKIFAGELVANARVQMDPGILGGFVVQAIQEAASAANVKAEITTLQSFSPAYPRPPYRLPQLA